MLTTAAIVIVALAMLTNVLPFRQIVDQGRQVAEAQSRLDALVAENDVLETQVDALQTPGEIERLARERLGYVRPGETQYVVIEPDEPEQIYPEDFQTGDVTGDAPAASWYERIWAYLTGADLTGG
jgi:cell division protein FtsB